MSLIQDLNAAHKDNRTFLHTRFGLGEDVLKPYMVGAPGDSKRSRLAESLGNRVKRRISHARN